MPTRRTFTLAGLCALLTGSTAAGGAGAADQPKTAFEVTKTDAEWRKLLTAQQYKILRQHGTEHAFTSPLDKNYEPGGYHCAGCDLPLFSSTTKFDSKTGWPSFWQPLDNAIGTTVDRSYFVTRTEVHCRRCGGHLGHVFDDGPPPTRLRYCMNGIAMKFVAKDKSQS